MYVFIRKRKGMREGVWVCLYGCRSEGRQGCNQVFVCVGVGVYFRE